MFFKRSFTIIEALVILALMLMIISLLSPSLQKATRYAREVKCTQGIRDLLVVSHQYAEDHDSAFPDIQRNPKDGGVVGNAFFAYRYWANLLEKDYGLNVETWYSPSNSNWSHEMFYQYNNGAHTVMGRSYFGAQSMQKTFEYRVLKKFKGSPSFASRNFENPSQKVLWTDLNRKLVGTDLFVNQIPGGVKNGANHLYRLSENWPELSHNGRLDGSVETAHAGEIEARFKNLGSVLHW
jgi:type II secretory pathway pseudopilin PulG